MPAPKVIVPPDYQIDLDRQPPRPSGSCAGALTLVFLSIAALAGAAYFVVNALAARNAPAAITPPTLEPATAIPVVMEVSATSTIDAWSATGTALVMVTATATTDYCWWVTPTPTPTETLPYTPDSWQATGTAIYLSENPIITSTATPDVPRAWCNNIPTNTPTMTPLRPGGSSQLVTATATIIMPNTSTATLTMTTQPVIDQPPYIVQPTQGDILIPPTVDVPPLPLPTAYPTATKNRLRRHKTTLVPLTLTPTFTPSPTFNRTVTIDAYPSFTPAPSR